MIFEPIPNHHVGKRIPVKEIFLAFSAVLLKVLRG